MSDTTAITLENGDTDLRSLRSHGIRGLGWTPDFPDIRDHTLSTPSVAHVLGPTATPLKAAPAQVDLEAGFSPVEDQGPIGSCCAQAGGGLLEYYERAALGRHVDVSQLFLYKVTRKLLGWTGDTGAYLRTTMKAMALFGVPPAEHYPYLIQRYDAEPDAFIYALAQNWQAIQYYRLDPTSNERVREADRAREAGESEALVSIGSQALANLKARLVLRQPAMFGFTVYSSMPQVTTTGIIPYPRPGDRVVGGHAVIAMGYDDAKVIDGVPGAIKIRNSWGVNWGQRGYGWIPYSYFTTRLAQDIWSLVRSEYIDLAPFA